MKRSTIALNSIALVVLLSACANTLNPASDSAKNLAGNIVKQSLDAAGDTLRKAGAMPGAVAEQVAKTLTPKGASSPAIKAAAASKPIPARKRKD